MPGFHDPGRRLQALRDAIDADTFERVRTVEDEIALAFAAAPLVKHATEFAANVPRRVAHNDAKLDNVLFRDGAAVCLVDLDTLMPGAWFWDIGDLLRTASTTSAEDEPRAERVVFDAALYDAAAAGYGRGVSTGVADAAEIDAIGAAGAIVTYEQAVRFLTDWIAGDVYYRTTRPGQNRDRARAQFRLLASMPGPVPLS
jgi:Ser/Thr protein kinase RdoA (MazF antagonist)